MNDNDLARLLRQETAKLRLARLERLVVASLGMGEGDRDFFKSLPVAGTVTDTVTLPLEVKAADDEVGAITGYLSTWDLDLGKDVVERGAYAKTIATARAFAKAHGSQALWPLLYQHKRDEPIGGIYDAYEDGKGLQVSCRLNLAIERGRQAYDGLKMGYLSFSIGFTPIKSNWQGKIRHITEIKLAEGSVVTFPMNLEARATPAGRAA
jgi:hypothetical protein